MFLKSDGFGIILDKCKTIVDQGFITKALFFFQSLIFEGGNVSCVTVDQLQVLGAFDFFMEICNREVLVESIFDLFIAVNDSRNGIFKSRGYKINLVIKDAEIQRKKCILDDFI